jgi:hypothetical protein
LINVTLKKLENYVLRKKVILISISFHWGSIIDCIWNDKKLDSNKIFDIDFKRIYSEILNMDIFKEKWTSTLKNFLKKYHYFVRNSNFFTQKQKNPNCLKRTNKFHIW